MANVPVTEVVQVDAVLDGLSSPTSSQVWDAVEEFSDTAIAVAAARRALAAGGGSQTIAEVLAEGADADGTGITNLGPTTLAGVNGVASITGPDPGAGTAADTKIVGAPAADDGYAGPSYLRGGDAGGIGEFDKAGAQFIAFGGSDDPEGSPAAGYAYMMAGSGASGDGQIACAPSAANGGDGSVQITGEKLSFFGASAVARPTLPINPTAGDIRDALVALGLVLQDS